MYEIINGCKYYRNEYYGTNDKNSSNNLESSTIKPNLDFGNSNDDDLIF